MNKIFKVIWSKSKQCYVVVSELAKNTTGKKENRCSIRLCRISYDRGHAKRTCDRWYR